MESLGKQLHTKRIEKGLTIHQVSQETRLSPNYIQAFEDEDYTVFPGTSYLVGFLRIYSEYLGMNADQVIQLYQKTKLQEQPLPINELLNQKPKRKKLIWIPIVFGILAVLGVIYYLEVQNLFPFSRMFNAAAPVRNIIDISGTEAMEERVIVGDELYLRIQGEEVILFVEDITQSVSIRSGDIFMRLDIGGEYSLDTNADGTADLSLQAQRIDSIQKRAVLLLTGVSAARLSDEVPDELLAIPVARNVGVELTEEGRQYIEDRARFISAANFPRDFSVVLGAVDVGFVRIQADDQQLEQPVAAGTRFDWNVREQFRIWTTNAGALQLQVESETVDLGEAGETVVGSIQWVESEDSYRLEFIPQF